MADATAHAVIKVTGDTTGLVRSVNQATDAQYKLTKAVEESAGGFGKFARSATDHLAKIGLAWQGLNAVLGSFKTALDMSKEVAQFERLSAAVPTDRFERLRAASLGVIEKGELLRLTVRGMSGDFALTEEQMGKVLRASVALSQRGFGDANEIAGQLIDKLAKGVDKLDDFGINLDKTTDRQGDLNRAMAAFDALPVGPLSDREQAMLKLRDAIAAVTMAIARLVTTILDGYMQVIELAKELGRGAVNNDTGFSQFLNTVTGVGAVKPFFNTANLEAQRAMERSRSGSNAFDGTRRAAAGYGLDTAPGAGFDDSAYLSNLGIDYDPNASVLGSQGTGPMRGRQPARGGGRGAEYTRSRITGGGDYAGSLGLGYRTDVAGAPLGFLPGQQGSLAGGAFGYESLLGGSQAGGMNEADKFMAGLQDRATLLGGAFGALSDGFAGAVDAIVTGSDSIGRAFAKASQQALRALAVEYGVRALGEGAHAIASLAFGDFGGAASHGIAAAKFAAAAAAAGGGSALLGSMAGGGRGAGAGPGAGAGAAGGFRPPSVGGGSPGGMQNITIYFGDGFVGNSQEVAEKVRDVVRDANRKGGQRNYATSFAG